MGSEEPMIRRAGRAGRLSEKSVDRMMDALPGSEFPKSELAAEAGVSRQSLYTHLYLLLALGVLEPVEDSSPQRYRVHADSELLDLLHRVNGTVNRHLSD